MKRLRSLLDLAKRIDIDKVPGDVVECGTCNGGSGAVLAHAAVQSPLGRHVWLLDSFAGLPAPDPKDGVRAKRHEGSCCGSPDRVREALSGCGVRPEAYTIVGGWFEDTLPGFSVTQIALLHIDADFYRPVLTVLETLYDRVTVGGFVVLDDYGTFAGCRLAFEEFFRGRGMEPHLTPVDGHAVYFQKPSTQANHAQL